MSLSQRTVSARLPANERNQDDDKVIAALELNGSLSRAQIAEQTGLGDEAAKRAMDRLRDAGMLRKLKERGASGKGGRQAALYDLGAEDDEPIKRAQTQVEIYRHPQDVAFFGEYRRVV